MSISFSSDAVRLHVNNPGYGEVIVQWRTSDADGELMAVNGPMLTMLLEQVTDLALGAVGAPRTLLPHHLDQERAADLLPALHRATVLAVAGSSRYEALYPAPEDGPRPPICVWCGARGAATSEDSRFSGWRHDHDHAPFGAGAGTTWEQAVVQYETQRTPVGAGLQR